MVAGIFRVWWCMWSSVIGFRWRFTGSPGKVCVLDFVVKICLSLFSYIRILKWQIGLRICIKQKNRKLIINKCWMIIEILPKGNLCSDPSLCLWFRSGCRKFRYVVLMLYIWKVCLFTEAVDSGMWHCQRILTGLYEKGSFRSRRYKFHNWLGDSGSGPGQPFWAGSRMLQDRGEGGRVCP